MSLDRLHPNQIRILKALEDAVAKLGMRNHLAVVDSLARYIAGEPKLPGDIDVYIEKPLCVKYWEFMEILAIHGIVSVFDVFDRPKYEWRYCRSIVGHALSLTIDCNANAICNIGLPGFKHANLDIRLAADDLALIPNSARWVGEFDPHDTTLASDPNQDREILRRHDQMVNNIRNLPINLQPPVPVPGFGLNYRLTALPASPQCGTPKGQTPAGP
jgi:hypothetical protein